MLARDARNQRIGLPLLEELQHRQHRALLDYVLRAVLKLFLTSSKQLTLRLTVVLVPGRKC